jgi:hypothetical protein
MFPKMTAPMDMAPVGLLLDVQRRNSETMREVMQCSMRGIQKAMMRQVAMVTRMVQDNTRMAETLGQEAPERRMQLQADLFGQVYRTSVEEAREMRAILAETEQEMSEIIGARVTASWTEMQSALHAGRAKPEAAASST